MSNLSSADAPIGDFVQAQGPAYLAHILLRLGDELVRAAARWYPEVGVIAPPRTTSTLLALDERGPLGITQIAALLHQSHPLVIDWCRQLTSLGLVVARPDPHDRRRSVVTLTKKGGQEVVRLRAALKGMARASEQLLEEGCPGLFEALWRMNEGLACASFLERLRDAASHLDIQEHSPSG